VLASLRGVRRGLRDATAGPVFPNRRTESHHPCE
jgi:hypothetical protein